MKKYYYSTQGCIKIGNDDFSLLFLNEKGEGSFWIYLISKTDNFDKSGYNYISHIFGKNVNVYECETNKRKIFQLAEGEYTFFAKKGDILIEKS